MKKLTFIADKIRAIYSTVTAKLPATFALVVAITIFTSAYGLMDSTTYPMDWLLYTGLAMIPGFLVTEAVDIREKTHARRVIGLVASFVISAVLVTLIYEYIPFTPVGSIQLPDTVVRNATMWMVVYLAACAAFGLYLSHRSLGISFEKYITSIFVKCMQTGILWGIIALGVLLLTFAFDELIISLDVKWFYVPQVLIMGLFAAPSFLTAIITVEEDIPRFFRAVIRYALLMITIAGGAIIYIYMAKLVITGDFPSNSVFEILSALFFVAIPTGYMCTSFEEEDLLQKIARRLPVIYAPFVLLQIYSIGARVVQYGFTPSRYVGLAFVAIEIIYILVYVFAGEHVDKLLFVILLVTAIICVVPGINAYSVSRSSQFKLVKEFLNSGETIDKTGERTESEISAYGAYQYLRENEKNFLESRLTDDQIAVLDSLRGPYYNIYTDDDGDMLYMWLEDETETYDIAGYSYISTFNIFGYESGGLNLEQVDIWINDDKTTLPPIDLTEEVPKFISMYENDEDLDGYTIMLEEDGVDYCLFVNTVDITYDESLDTVIGIDIDGYICW